LIALWPSRLSTLKLHPLKSKSNKLKLRNLLPKLMRRKRPPTPRRRQLKKPKRRLRPKQLRKRSKLKR
jgi:hypothetical protein